MHNETIIYLNGEYMPHDEACLSPNDRGFLFSDGVYEALCAYDGRLFKAEAHFERLRRSLQALRIEGAPDADTLRDVFHELLRRNDLAKRHAKLYLQITRGAPPQRQHAFPETPVAPTVYATAAPYTPPRSKWEEGVKVILHPDERWGRCDVKSVSLLPNTLANQRAQEEGAFEAVLTRDGVVTEGSHSSVLAVLDGRVHTHPSDPHILPGVTRDVVLDLCRTLDIPLREAPVSVPHFEDADEVILLGTTTGVMPVVQVDDHAVGDGTPGPITRTLQEAFLEETGLQEDEADAL